ncbi:MAG: endonuclease III, partial [Candidatus Micrarchaeota archaeon]|nr:endonuclease III [Candidatus Micrarchaeota archaeon]
MKYDHNYIDTILKRLAKTYGFNPHTQLAHQNIAELFVSVLLSPQNTDLQVNKTTQRLFKRFKTFDDYAGVNTRTLQSYLSSLNFYKTKARNLKKSAIMIQERFDGKVPKTIHELMELPGVGRKVANVILNEGYAINEGIAVDTHCG